MVAEAKPPKEDPRPAQELSEIIGTWDNVFSLGTLYRPPPELGGRQCQAEMMDMLEVTTKLH
jgi:hypothetical protein